MIRTAATADLCRRNREAITLALRPRRWVFFAQHRMSPTIILSSPLKTFARSPTPVDASSPLPSPGTLFGSQTAPQTPKRFKTANVQRDGFGRFPNARSLLGTKVGAENVPIRWPSVGKDALKVLSPRRFESTTTIARVRDMDITKNVMDMDDPIHDEDASFASTKATKSSALSVGLKRSNTTHTGVVPKTRPCAESQLKPTEAGSEQTVLTTYDDPIEVLDSSQTAPETAAAQERPSDVQEAKQVFSPLNLDMAISRRLDWTPTRDAVVLAEDASPSTSLSRSFSGGLLGSFGYSGDVAIATRVDCHEIDAAPTKRRRIDIIETNMSTNMAPPRTTAVKKAKATPRKALTITGLATSNYGKDAEERGKTALDHFLSLQAQALEANHDDIPSEVAKVRAMKEERSSRKNPKKSNVISPASAIEAIENQDTMFGYASQLAREDSPNLLRDTLEAVRRSELYNFSSPLRSQDTEPISVESTTPRAKSGAARFTTKRGLWAAAGRDEDNALLHVETIDIDTFNTPDLRHVFTGKDALVQPSASRTRKSKSPEKQSPSLRGSALLQLDTEDIWDIDIMKTSVGPARSISLPKMQVRALHTTERAESPRKRARPMVALEGFRMDEPQSSNVIAGPPCKKISKRAPKKPAFAGLTVEMLQKQIAAYGFKPMKKREQMIEVLEKCWDAKHVAAEQAPVVQAELVIEEVEDSLKHGDHLTKVHDLASRPVPKEKKPPKPKKGDEPKEPKEQKPRKRREPKGAKDRDPDAPKVIRKPKMKATLSEESFIDIVDTEDSGQTAVTTTADIAVKHSKKEASDQTKFNTPGKASSKTTSKATAKRPAALPSSSQAPASSTTFATSVPSSKEVSGSTITTSFETTIDGQIELAIVSYRAPVSTNHQRDPTWYEKILMYDPIVLEDLAAWLNTEGLREIGEDREVSALQVRDWCESRGICCLWRGGWRGNTVVKE